MSLQGLMSGSNPLLVMGAALLYFLFLYLRRGSSSDRTEHHETPARHSEQRSNDIVYRSEDGAAVSHVSIGDDDSPAIRHNHVTAAATQTATGGLTGALTGASAVSSAAAGYDFTDDTLRRHNAITRNDHDGTVVGGAAAGRLDHHTTHHTSGHHTAGASNAGDLRTPNVPAEYSYAEGRGGSWRFPVIAALCASLVSCQLASKDGIAGIPGNLASLFGGTSLAPVVAKIEAKVPDLTELKAKASEVKAEVKAKATEVVETTKAKVAAVAEKVAEAAAPAKPVAKVEVQADVKAAPVAQAVPGITHFYGKLASTMGAAFSAAAKMNADYAVAAAAPVKVADVAAAPVAAPVAGLTSYYGFAAKPDAQQTWAAPATVFGAVAAAAAPAPAAKAEAPAPAAPVPGVTSYYGIAERPDATFPWAAPATVYKVAAPAPGRARACTCVAWRRWRVVVLRHC